MTEPLDESQPGSDTSGPDGDYDGVAAQLPEGDTLMDAELDDPLDRGYSPPDREPKVDVPTQDEQARGESLEDKLAEEEPDPQASVGGGYEERPDQWAEPEVGARRAGRLAEEPGPDWDVIAEDVGVDGAAASAEEAAVHIVEDGQ